MFKISKLQVAALARPAVRKFAERMIRRLASHLSVDPATLVQVVEAGIDRAHDHGAGTERAVARFVDKLLADYDRLAPVTPVATAPPPPYQKPAAAAKPPPDDEYSNKDPVGALYPCPRKRNLRFSA